MKLFRVGMWGISKEMSGDKILITVGYKKHWYSWFSFIKERWFILDNNIWKELPGNILVEDINIIRFLHKLNNELKFTYIIK